MNRREFLSISAAGAAAAAVKAETPAGKDDFREKDSIKEVAGLLFYPGRDPFEQFRQAAGRLNGSGLDLLVTCEGMESVRKMTEAESPEHPGPMLEMYRDFAVRNHCTVAGSCKLAAEGHVYNALEFIGPDGKFLGDYRKNFLTKGEYDKGLFPGKTATVTQTPAGKLGGAICFDLNFDELRDQYTELKPSILCFASWYNAGLPVLSNWAFRTHSFLVTSVVDVPCRILDPLGRVLDTCNGYKGIVHARINLDYFALHGDFNMDKFDAIRREYGKAVVLDYDSDLGRGILYSVSPKITAAEIAKKYSLVSIFDYLKDSRRIRKEKLG